MAGSGIGVRLKLPVSVNVTSAAGNPKALPSVMPLDVPLPTHPANVPDPLLTL